MNWKTLLLASAFAALASMITGCGGDACDDAADKLEECGFTGGDSGDEDAECTGVSECAAECVNDASCEDITSTDPTSSYFTCIADCTSAQ